MNKTRFYEILQAAKKGEDLKQFVPTNAPEASLINDLAGGNGGAEYVEDITKSPVEVGSAGDIYVDVSAYTVEELQNIHGTILSDESLRGQHTAFENDEVRVYFDAAGIGFQYKDGSKENMWFEPYGGSWNNLDFSQPALINVKSITSVGKYYHLFDKLFYVAKSDTKLVANADITSEQLNKLDKVEVVTPTESKVIGGGSAGGASMVPTYFKYNNPNIGNMYYGMTIPCWNKIKVNVLETLDTLARLKRNTSFKDLCDNEEEAYSFLNECSFISLFYASAGGYYIPTEEDIENGNGDTPIFQGFGSTEDVSITFQITTNDDGQPIARVVFGGMGNFPKSDVVIDLSNGLYNGVENAGTIEYDISSIGIYGEALNKPKGSSTILHISTIMGGVYDLNKLEKFEAFSFE